MFLTNTTTWCSWYQTKDKSLAEHLLWLCCGFGNSNLSGPCIFISNKLTLGFQLGSALLPTLLACFFTLKLWTRMLLIVNAMVSLLVTMNINVLDKAPLLVKIQLWYFSDTGSFRHCILGPWDMESTPSGARTLFSCLASLAITCQLRCTV